MPFTFAHPAAVLPIHSRFRRWLSLSALVVGSMLPDAAYYMPLPDYYKETAHTWWGALYLSLPLGLLVLLIVRWIGPEVAFLMPEPHRTALGRAARPAHPSLRAALLAAAGLVIGAETHVLWDSFTHETGWAVQRFAWLSTPVWHDRAPLYFALQVLSTVLGMAILAAVYDRWMRGRGFNAFAWPRLDWRVFVWLAIAAGTVAAALAQSHTIEAIEHHDYRRTRHFALVFITSSVGDFLLAIFFAAIAVKIVRPRASRRLPAKPAPAQIDPA